jgi:hypothetical protein
MPCQQIGLRLVRVQSELVCSINLSHSAYKDSNYFVNSQKFMYICGMKENYKKSPSDGEVIFGAKQAKKAFILLLCIRPHRNTKQICKQYLYYANIICGSYRQLEKKLEKN